MTTHISKIARLPKTIRDQLATRIEDGQPGATIVPWLNSLPDVQAVLARHFAGRPISEQNLSDWKQTGHLDWLRRQESRLAAAQLLEQADDWEDDNAPDHRLADRFATVVAAEITRLAMTLLDQETDLEKKWQRLCQLNRELSRLRRDDHRATGATIQSQRWDLEISRQLSDALICEKLVEKNHRLDLLREERDKDDNTERFGGGPSGREKAELLYRIKCDLPINDLLDGTWQNPAKASPPGSDPTGAPVSRPGSSGLDKNCATRQVQPACPPTRKSKIENRKSSKTPAKSSKSSLIKPNPAKPATPADAGAPASGTARSQTTAAGPQPITHHESCISPPPQPESTPTPPLDPAAEAYNRWLRMHRGAEPFDYDLLQKLYAAIPQQSETGPAAPEQTEVGPAAPGPGSE